MAYKIIHTIAPRFLFPLLLQVKLIKDWQLSFLSLAIRSKAELNKNDIVTQNHAPYCVYETVEQRQEGKAPKKNMSG
ncbi:hypothetical protein [Bartonella sp. AA126HLJHH]|uniref:hypothetical protein n=1 Tax=Bartonella sp. AA126HLJHH TaxID=3243426 RepID=UPI0035CEC2A2